MRGSRILIAAWAVLMGLLLWVWQHPGLVLRPQLLRWGARYLARQGWKIDWRELQVDARSETFWNKTVRLRFEGLEVHGPGDEWEARAKDLELAAWARLRPGQFRWKPLGALQAEGLEANFGEPPRKSPDVGFETFRMENEGGLSGRFELAGKLSAPLRGAFQGGGVPGEKLFGLPREVWGEVRAQLPEGWQGQASARAVWSTARSMEYGLRATVQQGRRRVWLRSQGSWVPGRVDGVLDAIGREWAREFPRLELSECRFSHRYTEREGKLHLACPVQTRLALGLPGNASGFRLPETMRGHLSADLETPRLPIPDQLFSGQVRFDLEPFQTPWIEGAGSVVADYLGVPLELPRQGKLQTRAFVSLRVPRFSVWERELRKTPWAVPAPLNALDGELRLVANGVLEQGKATVPVELRTRLSGSGQKLDLDVDGELRLGLETGKSWLDLDVVLRDVMLAVPKLELERPPRFLPDPRLAKQAVPPGSGSAAGASGLETRFHVHTVDPGKPVRLLSNLAKAPVPLQLDVRWGSSQEPSGRLSVLPFPLDLFRRDAVLEQFRMDFDPRRPDFPIDGSFRVTYSNYVVKIQVQGTEVEPEIKLVSEPPVPEDELWAVLLFGEPAAALDAGQVESVGQARAAVADRALGLASLYLLASTPVESVQYNPSTGALNARFRLGGGSSLSLGTDSQERQYLGFRRRLGRHWTLSTDYSRPLSSSPGASESNMLSAFLEWSQRY